MVRFNFFQLIIKNFFLILIKIQPKSHQFFIQLTNFDIFFLLKIIVIFFITYLNYLLIKKLNPNC
jgi:hypothetical protein